MRISVWSSDVFSSDLHARPQALPDRAQRQVVTERVEARVLGTEARDTEAALFGNMRRQDRRSFRRQRLPDPERGEDLPARMRSEEHTSELQSLMRISYSVFCFIQYISLYSFFFFLFFFFF